MSKKALLLSTAFLFLLIIVVLWKFTPSEKHEYFLQIYLPYNDIVFWEEKIQPNDTFYHEYLHSVELSPVREYFTIDDEYRMIATESWTKSFGAGLPYETKDHLEIVDGFFVIQDHRELEYLNILPSHLYPHSFFYGEQSIDLSGELHGERIRIQVVKH
ncbi:DUF1850 domain-containing protein [Halalkalibacter okhensis]|uniref:DUF1850 domain-containing protein n=1 Tax=Halalkalibacter okhensis TaxID=333138 RepID=UPI00054F14A5|nr:DUF1850 domain-containing protein [Halalkalibacter okhensis]